MNRELLEALVRASSEVHEAHKTAKAAGREDLATLLVAAGWKIAAAISECVPDSAAVTEVVS